MTLLCFVCNSSLEGASNHLVNFVLSCLQEEKIAHPSGMEEMLKDLLGNGEKLKLSLLSVIWPKFQFVCQNLSQYSSVVTIPLMCLSTSTCAKNRYLTFCSI